jgi:hypothetical protein
MKDHPNVPYCKRNYLRRVLGIAICLFPVFFLVVSIVVGFIWPRESAWGIGIICVALLFAALNLYLAVIRPLLFSWRRGSMEGFRNVSGLPLFGTLFSLFGGIVGFADWRAAALGIVATSLDLGGLPWFLVATWRDRSLWDE